MSLKLQTMKMIFQFFTKAYCLTYSDNQGTVIEGLIENQNTVKALSVYAKHDENYMPASIKEN